MIDRDPYLLNPEDGTEIKSGLKSFSAGELCPVRNKLLIENGRCLVCEGLRPLWQFQKGSQQREIAATKSPKLSFFFEIVLPAKPEQQMILETGANAGNEIVDGILKKGWVDIVHPKAGKGRELTLTKSMNQKGYPTYSISPVLEKADWDVPDSVLNNLLNMDKIIEMMKDGTFQEGVNYLKASSLKQDDVFKFRLLPAHAEAKLFNKKIGIAWIYRHFGGVTKDEIDGKIKVDLTLPQKAEQKKTDDAPPWEQPKASVALSNLPDTKEKCWGMKNLYDESDPQCQKCKDFKGCGREALK